MSLARLASLIGVAILVLIVNVAMSFLYMVVYGYLINPGHPKEFYDQHAQAAAPWCSIVAGIPIVFLAAWWVSGWTALSDPSGVKAALAVWLSYAIIDLAIVLAVGGVTPKLALLIAISLITKLGAAYVGGLMGAPNAPSAAPTMLH